jgi:ketosteroid isomerase-like protein
MLTYEKRTQPKHQRTAERLPFGVRVVLLSFFGAVLLSICPAIAQERPSCRNPEFRQFDFWIGDWDVFEAGREIPIARARIGSILNGCVLQEDYRASDGHEGQSLTTYDMARNVWHQTCMTSGGTLLQIEGKLQEGEMVMSGKNQQGEVVRGVWKPLSGEVHEIAAKSADAGKTWQPWFDIVFRRRADTLSKTSTSKTPNLTRDEETVAALDAAYQDAVKRNDVTTMDRILADNFVLVGSSGKMTTKPELLAEAKSGRRIYEHQEDTDKTVRVWGDTAVVTARLWEKGVEEGKSFDYRLWFSDVYLRTPDGWRYVFAQSAFRPDNNAP